MKEAIRATGKANRRSEVVFPTLKNARFCGILTAKSPELEAFSLNINRAAIKANAKKQMLAAKPHVAVVGLVYYVISWVLNYLGDRVSGADTLQNLYSTSNPFRLFLYPQSEQASQALQRYWDQISLGGSLISIALQIVASTIALGFLIYALNVSRLRPAGIGTLFDGFSIFGRGLILRILMGIFIFLWSLLFIIPGIVAAYRYRMATYLLIDHPEMSPLDCIRASKEMMRGHKGELFVLDLSFIGWAILCIIPFVAVWVSPYMEVTYCNYYQALCGLAGAGGGVNQAPPREM